MKNTGTFAKDQFESGIAAKVLRLYVEEPLPYLDDAMKKSLATVQSDLLRRFTDIAFDESAQVRWQESQRTKGGGANQGPAAKTDLQNGFFELL